MQPFQPRGQLRAGRQAVIRRHQKVIGADLPAVLHVGVPCGIGLAR